MARPGPINKATVNATEPPSQSAEWHRVLVETIPHGIQVCDPEGVITFANAAHARMYGCTVEDLVGRTIWDLVDSEARKRELREHFAFLVREQPPPRPYVRRDRRWDGRLIAVQVDWNYERDETGRLTGFVSVLTDITQRKQAEEALQNLNERLEDEVQSRTEALTISNEVLQTEISRRRGVEQELRAGEQRLREILDSLFGFIGLYTTEGILVEANRAPLEAAQLRREDVIGKPFWETYWWSYSQHVQEQLKHALRRAANGETVRYDVPVRVAGGRLIEIDVMFGPLFDSEGNVSQLLGFAVDITDRKRAEQKLREHQENLAHFARLSTMGEMATGLAHELNQPLAAISTYCSAGLEVLSGTDLRGEATIREFLEKMSDQAMRASEIIRRLRGLVRRKRTARSQVDLVELIDEVLQLLEPDLRQSEVRVQLELDRSNRLVLVDEIQIQQVLVNLIRNALEAMRGGEPGALTLCTTCAGRGLIEVAVRDTGRGIPLESREHVFDAFYSTKPDGMGMGLAISRTIVEAHGGDLWMAPNPDRGATFHFTVPTASGRMGRADPPPEPR